MTADSFAASGPPAQTDGSGAGESSDALDGDHTVLVVDDEAEFAEAVGDWIDQRWNAVVATDGEEALEKYGPHVDAVLLDRRMPKRSGDETLREIRERDGSARVAMLTALEPDLNVVELDYDMYLEKPVDREEVVDATRELLERANYTRELRALYALSSKIAELQARYDESKLADDERFQRLQTELERVREQAAAQLDGTDDGTMAELLQVVEDADR
ncbi:receiver box response regulator [Halobacterium hubeiense]|uniref:Receiver box response regulator n=1 Tax=Halobacterium hubeiense TaxID=1407499 RepID=A0A0U5GYN7_9EURY|nr:response regulator [Halobacterium hubeiense]CQH51423.1 receiver box response regulator [Halobacterium hubeiense]